MHIMFKDACKVLMPDPSKMSQISIASILLHLTERPRISSNLDI